MRRMLVRIVIAAALGVGTSIALAWALAAWMPISANVPRSPVGAFERWGRAWHRVDHRQFGIVIRFWGDLARGKRIDNAATLLEALGPPPPSMLVERAYKDFRDVIDRAQVGNPPRPAFTIDNSIPSWGTFADDTPPPETIAHGSDSGFGWPRPCMWYQVQTGINLFRLSTTSDTLVGGVRVSGEVSGVVPGFHALPLRPIWSGLAVDGAVWGGAWWLVLFGPAIARRTVRRWRGVCLSCGYDARTLPEGAPCPECGSALSRGSGLPRSSG